MKKIFLLFSMVILFSIEIFSQAIPKQIVYQGVLKDASGNLINGNQQVTFKIYNDPTGGTALWTEIQVINFDNGLFNAHLGSTTPITTVPFDRIHFLGITIASEPELLPRTMLTPTPYSFMTMDILNNTISTDKLQDGAVTGTKIANNSVVKSLNTLKDDVTLVAGTNITITPSGNNLTISATGGGSGTIGGSGTANYIPLFTNTTTIGNSVIYQTGSGFVGINKNNPVHSLDVYSESQVGIEYYGNNDYWTSIYVNALKLTATSGFGYLRGGGLKAYSGLDDDDKWFISNPGSTNRRLVIDSDGNIGIGTNSPAYKLELLDESDLLVSFNVTKNTSTSSQAVFVEKLGASGVGIKGYNSGSTGSGVSGQSANWVGTWGQVDLASNNYGLYTPDNLYSLNYHTSGAIMHIVRNASNEILTEGDVVSIAGIEQMADGVQIIRVEKSNSQKLYGVVGVVYSYYSEQYLPINSKVEGNMNIPKDIRTTVQPGEYLLIVTEGPAKVKTEADVKGLRAGDLISVSEINGYAGKVREILVNGINLPVPGTVIGKLLNPIDTQKPELSTVYVNLK